MAFDGTLPQNNAPIVAAELRDQFNGLNEMITQCAGLPDKLAPLQITISNPPTQAQVQMIVNRLNDLLEALQRA